MKYDYENKELPKDETPPDAPAPLPEEVNQPVGAPIAGQEGVAIDRETLSHQWQKDSPAIDTNVSIGVPKTNAFAGPASPAAPSVIDYEGDCSKLDVSDARYCNPGSERHKAYLASK